MVSIQKFIDQKYSTKKDKENLREIIISYNSSQEEKEIFKELDGGELDLREYPNLEKLDINGKYLKNKLTKLDISNCFKLVSIVCDSNKLTSLLFHCPGLIKLDCFDNKLTSLDFSSCPNLSKLNCCSNQITSLNLSSCSNLTDLRCSDNQLVDLDLSDCKLLSGFWCSFNSLTNANFLLNLPNPKKLVDLDLGDNNFAPQDLSFLVPFVNLEFLRLWNVSQKRMDKGTYNRFYGSLEYLKNMTKLEDLGIANTDIDSGLDYLENTKVRFVPFEKRELYYTETNLEEGEVIGKRIGAKVAKIQEQLFPFDYNVKTWREDFEFRLSREGFKRINIKWIKNKNLTALLDKKIETVDTNEEKITGELLNQNREVYISEDAWSIFEKYSEVDEDIIDCQYLDFETKQNPAQIGDIFTIQGKICAVETWGNDLHWLRLHDSNKKGQNYRQLNGDNNPWWVDTDYDFKDYLNKEVIFRLRLKQNKRPRYEVVKESVQLSLRQQEADYLKWGIDDIQKSYEEEDGIRSKFKQRWWMKELEDQLVQSQEELNFHQEEAKELKDKLESFIVSEKKESDPKEKEKLQEQINFLIQRIEEAKQKKKMAKENFREVELLLERSKGELKVKEEKVRRLGEKLTKPITSRTYYQKAMEIDNILREFSTEYLMLNLENKCQKEEIQELKNRLKFVERIIEQNEELISNKDLEEQSEKHELCKYGLCEECNRSNTARNYYTNEPWCQSCNARRFQDNFKNWTSGNSNVDVLIQKFQLEAINDKGVLEWIPYEQFKNIEYLAEGGFGKVYKAEWIEGSIESWDSENKKWKRRKIYPHGMVALKSLNSSQNMAIEFLQEIANHKVVASEFWDCIVPCYGISQDPVTKNYLMVMEYIEGGNLRQYLNKGKNSGKLNFNNKLGRLVDISGGLKRIHEKGLIHHDLHVGNVLNSESDNCLITDLGLCCPPNEISKGEVYGVLPYIAPEVLHGKHFSSKASDIYSFGIIAYEVLSGFPPYHGLDYDGNLAIEICLGFRPDLSNINAPKLLKNLIVRCWNADPKQRPTASELSEVLNGWCWEIGNKKDTEFTQQVKEEEKFSQRLSSDKNRDSDYTMHSSKLINTKQITQQLQLKHLEYHTKSLEGLNIDDLNLEELNLQEDPQEQSSTQAQIEIPPKSDN